MMCVLMCDSVYSRKQESGLTRSKVPVCLYCFLLHWESTVCQKQTTDKSMERPESKSYQSINESLQMQMEREVHQMVSEVWKWMMDSLCIEIKPYLFFPVQYFWRHLQWCFWVHLNTDNNWCVSQGPGLKPGEAYTGLVCETALSTINWTQKLNETVVISWTISQCDTAHTINTLDRRVFQICSNPQVYLNIVPVSRASTNLIVFSSPLLLLFKRLLLLTHQQGQTL